MRIARITFRGRPRECVEGQLIVKLRPEALERGRSAEDIFAEALGRQQIFRVAQTFDEHGVGLVEFPCRSDLSALADRLESHEDVEYAEPNDLATASPAEIQTNDPLFPTQWGLLTIQAPAAWTFTQGAADVVIAVLDSGIPMQGVPPRLCHPDLVDTIRFCLGGNYVSPGSPPIDDNGHGTHVLGIIAGEVNNREGVAGVNWRSSVLVCKVFDRNGSGNTFMVYSAAREAIEFARGRNAQMVINYSGGGRNFSATWEQTALLARDAGALVCAATGNDYSQQVRYPAALAARADGSVWYDNVIAVGATDIDERKADFSNYGLQVTVVAPGVGIQSTMPPYSVTMTGVNYHPHSGTSMATPFVSGIASLVWSVERDFTPAQVRRRIEQTAVDLGPPGDDQFFGAGRVNAYAAVCPDQEPELALGAILSHVWSTGINLAWAQVYGQHRASWQAIRRYLNAAQAHAYMAQIFLVPDGNIQYALQLMGDYPRVVGAVEAAMGYLGGQLRDYAGFTQDGRRAVLSHIWSTGINLAWAQTYCQFPAHTADQVTRYLRQGRDHARAAEVWYIPLVVFNEILMVMMNSGVGVATCRAIEAAMDKLGREIQDVPCMIET